MQPRGCMGRASLYLYLLREQLSSIHEQDGRISLGGCPCGFSVQWGCITVIYFVHIAPAVGGAHNLGPPNTRGINLSYITPAIGSAYDVGRSNTRGTSVCGHNLHGS